MSVVIPWQTLGSALDFIGDYGEPFGDGNAWIMSRMARGNPWRLKDDLDISR